jgi:hypothetical protein
MRLPVVLTEATKWLMLREITEIVNRGMSAVNLLTRYG